MLRLFSIILILSILISLLVLKRSLIIKFFNKKKIELYNNVEENQAKISSSALKKEFPITNHIKVYSHNERIFLKRKMKSLFTGSKEDKLKALKIAKDLSDTSTLPILRMGLKDMDSDIVKISADLIDNFK
tara:strand:+ start:36 stop:428 length:393 start_codon:yes stop_codon:yes gene_type:complete